MLQDEHGVLRSATGPEYVTALRLPQAMTERVAIDFCPVAFLDSANITPTHWISIAQAIGQRYEQYDGFVVLHGSDTLSYTASALSFLLENLGKPVVVTGAQLPFDAPQSDARYNFLNAVAVAGAIDVPPINEVMVVFGDRVLRGNRTRSTGGGFDSPHFPQLGTIGRAIIIDQRFATPAHTTLPFRVNSQLSDGVIDIAAFPGCEKTVSRALSDPAVEGVLLRCFGQGNIPQSLNPHIRSALMRGTAVLIVGTGEHLLDSPYTLERDSHSAGVASGIDMTPEAALVKLMVAVGYRVPPGVTRSILEGNQRGEMTSRLGTFDTLYSSRPSPVARIELFNEVNEELLRFLGRHPKELFDLTPRKFEIVVSEIFRHHGFHTELTPMTRDGGFDFTAMMVDSLGDPVMTLVETKQFAPDRPVGVAPVRSLYGVVNARDSARGIIVTTSRFTRDAEQFAGAVAHRISLNGYTDVARWLRTLFRVV